MLKMREDPWFGLFGVLTVQYSWLSISGERGNVGSGIAEK